MWFWKKVNPRTLKMIEDGAFDAQLSNTSLAFTVVHVNATFERAVDQGLRDNRLGYAEARDQEIRCYAPVGWEDWAAALVTNVLRAEKAPQDALLKLRSGALRSIWRTEGAFVRGKRTRKGPEAGDIFSYSSGASRWFGRVIRTDLPGQTGRRTLLVYFYRPQVAVAATDIPALSPRDLLVPPMKIDETPWTLGYFAKVVSVPVAATDVLPHHCFRHPGTGNCFDEFDNPSECSTGCGEHGVATWMTVEVALSIAHGLPLAAPSA